MDNTILKNKKIHQATLLVYKGSDKVAEMSKGDMTSDSPFAIASISKLYTDALIFWLIDQKRLSYDSCLTDLLPGTMIDGLSNIDKVTVRHLVDQTSGFANYEMDKFPNGTVLFEELLRHDRPVGVEDALKMVSELPSRGEPGERAYYADINALLLGEICQNITGKSLPKLLEQVICRPLGLTSTHYYTLTEKDVAPIHNGDCVVMLPKYLSTQMAQGGIISTNKELMRFLQAFFGGELFSKEHITDPTFRPIQFVPLKYGSGMMQLKIPRILSPFIPAPEIIGHSGASGSFAFYCPSKDVFVTGTINQVKHRPFEVIYRSIDRVTQ